MRDETKTQGDCEDLLGDVLSIQVYYDPRSNKDQSPNYDKVRVGLIPQALAGAKSHAIDRGATPETDEAVAYGSFTTNKPGDDGYCTVPVLSSAHLVVPAIDEATDECGTTPAEPRLDQRYDFSDFRAYNTPGAYGTQIMATLRYRTPTCDATYRVTGIYPSIPCGVDPEVDAGTEVDAGLGGSIDGGLDLDAALDGAIPLDPDGGTLLPQEEAPTEPDCPTPDEPGPAQVPDDGACIGTGISPEFTATCDPTLLLCLLPGQSTMP